MDLAPLKIDRSQSPKRARATRSAGRRLPWGWLVGLAVVGGAVYVFERPLREGVDRFRLPEVQVVRVERSSAVEVGAVRGIAANGYVVASRRAALSADTPGRLVDMRVTEGQAVREGEVVARLFSQEFEAALQQARAQIAVAEAAHTQAEAQTRSAEADRLRAVAALEAARARVAGDSANLELARRELARAQELVAQRVATTRELDRAQAEIERARAQLATSERLADQASAEAEAGAQRVAVAQSAAQVAQAQVEASRAAAALAAATLSKTEVVAPFDGVVVLKDAEVGEVVSPNSGGGTNARGSVATLVDFSSLEVQADVPETSLKAVELEAPCQIFLDAYPEVAYAGRVSRIWPTANRQKATVEVRIQFKTLDARLRPEMGVRVVFSGEAPQADTAGEADTETEEPQILVPETAVVRVSGGAGVFVVEREVARWVEVAAGERRGGQVVIAQSALREGDLVVLEPPATLEDGDRVRVTGG